VSAAAKRNLGSALPPAEGTQNGAKKADDVSGSGARESDLDPLALRALSQKISRDYSHQLEHTALVLYDRDPEYLQAQWYVTPEELAQARSAFPGEGADLRQVLRLRRLEEDGRAQIVASVRKGGAESTGEGQEGFALHGDGAEYECELGLESDTGGWLVLARSNRVALPNGNIPPPQRIEPLSGDSQATSAPSGDGEWPDECEDIPVEAALAAVGEPLYPVFPSLEPEISRPSGRSPAAEEARGQVQTGDWRRQFPDDAFQQPARDRQYAKRAAPDASLASMPPPLLPSSTAPGGPPDLLDAFYDPRAALSSAGPRGVQWSAFDMDIQAELIVQGRARAGSVIELFGRRVSVGDDGRFYIRRPIEDPVLLSIVVGARPISGPGDPETE
jgi:hypothetical protein